MQQVIITAVLLLGTAVPGASAAQQHQHGARPDTSHVQHNRRPASVHPQVLSDFPPISAGCTAIPPTIA